jgi:hypothetical protein
MNPRRASQATHDRNASIDLRESGANDPKGQMQTTSQSEGAIKICGGKRDAGHNQVRIYGLLLTGNTFPISPLQRDARLHKHNACKQSDPDKNNEMKLNWASSDAQAPAFADPASRDGATGTVRVSM